MIYTLAGLEGPHGWGRAGDTFNLNDELGRFGIDNTFQLGDRDLALKLYRTNAMRHGAPLSSVTQDVTAAFGIGARVLPASDDRLRTSVKTDDGWLTFQEYFVDRRHRDEVLELRFEGDGRVDPAPGVPEAIATADLLLIGPSNPPLSIWPILAVDGVRDLVRSHPSVTVVSPLIGGKTVKGPADRVMSSLGLPGGNRGVAAAYEGLADRLVIDVADRDDAGSLEGVEVLVTPTLIKERDESERLARELTGL